MNMRTYCFARTPSFPQATTVARSAAGACTLGRGRVSSRCAYPLACLHALNPLAHGSFHRSRHQNHTLHTYMHLQGTQDLLAGMLVHAWWPCLHSQPPFMSVDHPFLQAWQAHKNHKIRALCVTPWGDLWTASGSGAIRVWAYPGGTFGGYGYWLLLLRPLHPSSLNLGLV